MKNSQESINARRRKLPIYHISSLLAKYRDKQPEFLEQELFALRLATFRMESELIQTAKEYGDVYREYMLVLSAIVFKLYPSSDTELINLTQWKSEPVKEGMKKISHLRKASTLFSADIYLESKGPSSWQVISRVQRTRMRGFEFPLGSDANSLYERQKFKMIGAAKDYISKKMFKLDHEFFRPSVQSLVPMKYENMFLTFGLYLLCYQYESRPKRA